MHQSDVMGSGRGPDWLNGARDRLLQVIATHLQARDLAATTVVFDRHTKKTIRAEQVEPSGIRVLFAVDYPEADDLIERLIARHPQPRLLTLVSSDHRLQQAAKRNGAAFSDADVWYDRLLAGKVRSRRTHPPRSRARDGMPDTQSQPTLTDEELAQWMDAFEADALQQEFTQDQWDAVIPTASFEAPPSNSPDDALQSETSSGDDAIDQHLKRQLENRQYNPFPEGYGEDLLDP